MYVLYQELIYLCALVHKRGCAYMHTSGSKYPISQVVAYTMPNSIFAVMVGLFRNVKDIPVAVVQ